MKNYKFDFPIFKRKVHGKPLVYLDSAATSQIPKVVVDAMNEYEFNHRANVHRGVHLLSEESTLMYESARKKVANFIDANVPEEIVFTRNATESINLVAYSWGEKNIKQGEIILVSEAEHHSNLVPWQNLISRTGCEVVYIPVNEDGFVDIKNTKVDWERVRLVAYAHISNVLGSINDVKEINKCIKKRVIEAKHLKAEQANSKMHFPRIIIDSSQAVPHMRVSVKKLGADFVAFSGHKMYGPMGIGVLWINRDIFHELKPFILGGGMIKEVHLDHTTYAPMPEMLEGGTPNVSGAVGLAAACEYISNIGYDEISRLEEEVMQYALRQINREDINIYGTVDSKKRASLISFNVKKIPSHDLASVLDAEGVAIRSGQHCVMPWHMKNLLQTTARVSLGIYNTKDDIDSLVKAIDKAKIILTS